MLTPWMIDEDYRQAQCVRSTDFCGDTSIDRHAVFINAMSHDRQLVAVSLYEAAATAVYAQAILQATGAL